MEKIRPSKLSFVTIAAMSLGGLGYFSALSGTASVAGGEAIQSLSQMGNQEQFGHEFARINDEMQAKLLNVTQSRKGTFYALYAVHVVVASLLLGGGFLSHKMKASGRKLLMVAFAVTILFELVRIFPTIAVQLEVLEIMQEYGPKLTKSMKGPKEMQGFMTSMMQGSTAAGIVFALAFMVAKIGFYGFGFHYLKKNEELFTAA